MSATLQRWFVIVWAVAVLVMGVLVLKEREQAADDKEFEEFVCKLSSDYPELC